MGLFDRFKKPKWEHEDPKIRIEGIKELDDKEILIKMAKTDSDSDVRKIAVGKVNDESVLIDVAKNASDWKVRQKAVSKISDESVLADIAINDEDVNVCVDAVERISDESLLADIAKNARPACFERAIKKINDPEILENIAIDYGDCFTRFTAEVLSNINDESSLGRIANGTTSDDVIKYIIPRINDKDILESISTNALNDNARKLADDKINTDSKCNNCRKT